MRSPSPAKMTLCSPITEPPRSEAKPIAPRLRGRDAVAAALRMPCEVDIAPLGRRFAEQQRGAGRRIDLHAVVHLEDLDVVIRPERPRRVAHQLGEQIDAEAHIARADDRRMARGGGEARQIVSVRPVVPITCETRAWAASAAISTRRRGRGKVEDAFSVQQRGERIVGDLHAGRADARERPASSPSAGEPARSIAAASVTPGVSAIVLTSMRPMRPAAPVTTSRISSAIAVPDFAFSPAAARRSLR